MGNLNLQIICADGAAEGAQAGDNQISILHTQLENSRCTSIFSKMDLAFVTPLLPTTSGLAGKNSQRLCRRRPRHMPRASLDYASSGVDISAESASVSALLTALGSSGNPRASGTRGSSVPHGGGFSGLIEFGNDLLALCTDGVGSKMLLAEELGIYDTVAIDCMAMNVNDLLCVGAEPLAFVDYIATPRPRPEIWEALGRSLAKACELANVTLSGGETASLPELVRGIDLSGTALGSVDKGFQISGEAVRVGDRLIGIPSSGIHSNGYTLVRRIVAMSGANLQEPFAFPLSSEDRARVWRADRSETGPPTLGEVLLTPTRIYVNPLVAMLARMKEGTGPAPYDALHGIAHITGGGLSNLLRLKKGVGFCVSDPLPVYPEFQWLQATGRIAHSEMHKVFNMGMGMCLVVDEQHAEKICKWIAIRAPGTKIVGEVNASGKVTHAIESVVFEEY